jgi:DNA-cytosine methyltransferase
MNVLSLFDGMSCGRIALEKCGFQVDKYFASEIDKYAIKVAKENYPDTIHIGDVQDVRAGDLPQIDLLIGGSPCQGFSFAGKQLNFDDPRSKLFWEFVRLLRDCKPKYFLLENVKMKKQSMDVITEALGVEPIFINSSLVSAQNRQRYYWTNIPMDGLPEDKGIKLRDILEDGFVDRDKSHCLDANYFKGGNLKSYFEKHRRQLVFSKDGLCHVGDADIKGNDTIRRVYHPDGKAPTLTTMGGGHREPKVLVKGGRIVNRRLDENGVRKDYDKDIPLQPRVEVRKDDKTNCLTTVYKDSVVVEDMTWRKLTPLECERLQTVPEGYTSSVSNTQRYKMLGNGWTVDVVAHIMKGMKL